MRELPLIACSLTGEQLAARAEEFRALLASARRVERIERGARVLLASGAEALTRDLLAREQECCPFWDFTITTDADGVTVEALAPADAAPIVDALFFPTA